MRLSHEGLTLWYGTADAPAPDGIEEGRSGVSVSVAVQPASPSNVVAVRYRVDGGPVQQVPALGMRTDYARSTQYFRATFPDFWVGDQVEYLPILSCAGRQVPDPEAAGTFPTSFRLGGRPGAPSRASGLPERERRPPPAPRRGRLPYSLDYLATVTVPLDEPEIVGVTPEGITVNWFWYPKEGTVEGPQIHARVRPLGGDWMTIRRDGIGIMGVHATIETADGALIYASYSGVFELGEDGYQRFLDRRWPPAPTTRSTPRFLTTHPKYRWLNRLQCLGVGEIRMAELIYTYDLYAFR